MFWAVTGLPSFLRPNNIPLFGYAIFCLSIRQWTLGCFPVLAIVNNGARYMGLEISLQDTAFNSLEHIPRSGIDGSYGNSILNLLRNHHTILHSGCTISHSHQWHARVSISPHPHQHLLIYVLLIVAILVV